MFALMFGSAFWLAGGVALVAALLSGWTLFAPFAAALILFGVGASAYGVIELLRG